MPTKKYRTKMARLALYVPANVKETLMREAEKKGKSLNELAVEIFNDYCRRTWEREREKERQLKHLMEVLRRR